MQKVVKLTRLICFLIALRAKWGIFKGKYSKELLYF